MGLKVEPAYIGQTGYLHPVELDRNLLEGLFQRSGGVRYGDLAISQGVGTRAIAIAPGRFFILGQENAQQGGYFVWSDAVDTFLLAAAVGNPRIDTLLVRVIDDQYGSISGAPRAEYAVVQGVASGSPTARPDSDFNVGGSFYIPGGWARLGDVRVNVADTGSIPTGQITTKNRYVRGPSGNVPCLSTDRPSDPVFGDRIYETDTTFVRAWDGTTWKQAEAWKTTLALASNAADLTITGVPSSLRRMHMEYYVRCAGAVAVANLMLRINATATNHVYTHTLMINTTLNGLANDQGNGSFPISIMPGSTSPAGFFGSGVADFQNVGYQNSLGLRIHWQTGMYGNTAAQAYNAYGEGLYLNAGPYTQYRLFDNAASQIVAGSWVTLEGWE